MPELTLYLGNRNYSSWSMRAGLALRLSGAAFREEQFDLAAAGVRDEILHLSPAGKVPFLRAGDVVIWDSLAIFEYLAETCPDVAMWPRDPAARAVARSVAAEMHAGFPRLRASITRARAPWSSTSKAIFFRIDLFVLARVTNSNRRRAQCSANFERRFCLIRLRKVFSR